MEALMYRADEVAAALRIGRSKAYAMMASGELPTVRLGRAVRVPRAALDAWIRAQTGPVTAEADEGRR